MARRQHRHTIVNPDGSPGEKAVYWSLREELMADLSQDFVTYVTEAFGGTLPTDIDDYRARINPLAPLQAFLMANGVTQAQYDALPNALKLSWRFFSRVALMAIMFDHGKVPSIPNSIMDRQDPVP